MATYYVNLSIPSTGENGLTPDTPFGMNEFVSATLGTGHTFYCWGSGVTTASQIGTHANNIILPYNPSVNGRWAIGLNGSSPEIDFLCHSYYGIVANLSNNAIRLASNYNFPFTHYGTLFTSLFEKPLYVGAVTNETLTFKGCYFNNFDIILRYFTAQPGPPPSNNYCNLHDCIYVSSSPMSGMCIAGVPDPTRAHINIYGGYATNLPSINPAASATLDTSPDPSLVKTSWSPVALPAWNDNVKDNWKSSILAAGIDPIPFAGSGTYSGYEKGFWDSARIGIGAFYFASATTTPAPSVGKLYSTKRTVTNNTIYDTFLN